MQDFTQLKLSPGTLDAIAAMGYETPSPIQAQAIPHLVAGKDLLGQARTGTGKTAAFGIPMVEKLRTVRDAGLAGLILVPTRELALQVTEELTDIAKGSGIQVIPVYGGVGMGRQTDELGRRGTQIVVATPGRLLDHLGQRSVSLSKVQFLVLDEADRMLDMGFLPDMEKVLRAVPVVRQTALFSATVPEPIRRLTGRFLKEPVSVRVETGETTTPLAEQFKLTVAKDHKGRALQALLHKEQPERAIVFTRTKHLARRLAEQLQKAGWSAVPLQGNMSQGQRERAMDAFRKGQARVLVATDVAARGIDVPEIGHVFNYDLPDEPEAYVHRIGRTGRMGRTGKAFTFVQPDQLRDLRDVERTAGVSLIAMDLGLLPVELPEGPDAGKAAVQYKGDGQSGGGGRGHGGGSGHHAKKRPQGGQSGHGGHGGGHGGQGGRSSGGGGGGGRSGGPRQGGGGRGPGRASQGGGRPRW